MAWELGGPTSPVQTLMKTDIIPDVTSYSPISCEPLAKTKRCIKDDGIHGSMLWPGAENAGQVSPSRPNNFLWRSTGHLGLTGSALALIRHKLDSGHLQDSATMLQQYMTERACKLMTSS